MPSICIWLHFDIIHLFEHESYSSAVTLFLFNNSIILGRFPVDLEPYLGILGVPEWDPIAGLY